MTINIKLPENEVKCGLGTRVFTDTGHEITDISEITVSIRPDEFITATIEVAIGSDTDLSRILAELGHDSIESYAKAKGYRLIEDRPKPDAPKPETPRSVTRKESVG